jgi:uncharacterized protein
MLRDRIHELGDEIEALARKHGAVRIRLFGSVARGEERPDSDVDFLVALEEGRSLLDFVGLKLDLEELLERKVDLVSEGAVSRWLEKRIYREAQPILVSDPPAALSCTGVPPSEAGAGSRQSRRVQSATDN